MKLRWILIIGLGLVCTIETTVLIFRARQAEWQRLASERTVQKLRWRHEVRVVLDATMPAFERFKNASPPKEKLELLKIECRSGIASEFKRILIVQLHQRSCQLYLSNDFFVFQEGSFWWFYSRAKILDYR